MPSQDQLSPGEFKETIDRLYEHPGRTDRMVGNSNNFNTVVTLRSILFDRCSFNAYMLFTGLEVRIGKNCARGLEYGRRPQAEGHIQDREHSFSQYGPT